MNILMFVPGGVDPGGGYGVIPALTSLIERLSSIHRVTVAALNQPAAPRRFPLFKAEVFNLCSSSAYLNRKTLPGAVFRAGGLFSSRNRPFDIVHAFWIGWSSTLAFTGGRLFRCPVVVSLGGGELVNLKAIGFGGARRITGRCHAFLAMRRAEIMTAGSSYSLDLLKSTRPDAVKVPLFSDIGVREIKRCGEQEAPGRFHLLTVASINRVKDPFTLLRALRMVAKKIPGVVLDWVGEDVLDGAVHRFAQKLKLHDHVRFHGFRPPASLPDYFRRAEIYVQSSLYESQGVAVCEAAVSGLALVGTHVGIMAELSPDCALTSAPGDHRRLAQNLIRVLENDGLRRRLIRNTVYRARGFTADRTATDFENIYRKILARGRNG